MGPARAKVVVLLVEGVVVVLLVEGVQMLTQLHVQLKVVVLVVLLPRLLELLAHRRRALAARPQRGGAERAPPGLP